MTNIEKKALALVNEVRAERSGYPQQHLCRKDTYVYEALCRAIEQHEAFRQEVSDAVSGFFADDGFDRTGLLWRFIIAKPDPLVEIVDKVARDLHITGASTLRTFRSDDFRNALREALAKHGGKIVWENSDA